MELEQFKATYCDMIERLDKAMDIASTHLGDHWSWTGELTIEGDTIKATLSAYYSGEADFEHVSFPLEWLWTGGPDGDLALTFQKGRDYQQALNENRSAEAAARKQDEQDKRDRRELERLQIKFADDAAEEGQ